MRRVETLLRTQYLKAQQQSVYSHHILANRRGKHGTSDRLNILQLQNHCEY